MNKALVAARHLWLPWTPLPLLLIVTIVYVGSGSWRDSVVGNSLAALAFLTEFLNVRQYQLFNRLRLAWSVRNFVTDELSPIVTLHHPAAKSIDVPAIEAHCTEEYARISAWLELHIPQPQPLHVFSFERAFNVLTTYGHSKHCLYIDVSRALFTASDNAFRQSLSEGLTLAAAAYRGSYLPLWKSRGLAIWLARKGQLPNLSEQAKALRSTMPLSKLLAVPGHFKPTRGNHHFIELASHFTAFLLDHFGKQAYFRFYAEGNYYRNVPRAFQNAFDCSIDQCVNIWSAN